MVYASEPVPVSGRRRPSGSTSGGTPIPFKAGAMKPIIKSSAPEARKTLMATSMPTRWGIMAMAVPKPSLAPSTKDS
ncbi:hypothetical protein D3C86_1904800 [compost metagenome]